MYAAAAGTVVLVVIALGLAFAGSRQVLAEGTHVAGVDVGGLTQREAVLALERKFSKVASDPVTFVAGEESFSFGANQLGVEPDWQAGVAAARRAGDGFGPIRGFRRLHTRVFGAEVLPRLAVSDAALDYALDQIAARVDRRPRNAALVRRGLRIATVSDRAGARVDREHAARTIVRALGSIERNGGAVTLAVVAAEPKVTAGELAPVARLARIAVSGPVTLRGANRTWRVPRWRIARLLELPKAGETRLAIGGREANEYFRALGERVGKTPVDAEFVVSGETVGIIPSSNGTELDVNRTSRALLRASTSPTNRLAKLTIVQAVPEITTAEAQAMGIDRRMASYKTWNSGTWDRITNLRLGVTLLDGTLVEPGGTFSLNDAIGERTAERGFRSAPVIIGTRYEEEIGGGTSQVATTVFNSAWEAGVEITERNPHSLYISRYPTGRDATVYWPSLDLTFQNDTKSWILVKGFVEADGISVALYGGENRRVESSEGKLTITGIVPVKHVKDATMPKGEELVEQEGSAPSRTSVTRTIYAADGTLIDEEVWTTSYRGETRIVRIGTKVKTPDPEPKPPEKPNPTGDGGPTTPAPTTPTPTRP
jgi:vancomycin resistance protein YoaR